MPKHKIHFKVLTSTFRDSVIKDEKSNDHEKRKLMMNILISFLG